MSRIPTDAIVSLSLPHGTELCLKPTGTTLVTAVEVGVSDSITTTSVYGPYLSDITFVVEPTDGYCVYETIDPALPSNVQVTNPIHLSGTLDSTKAYIIHGVIDFTGTGLHIEVPVGGLTIIGSGANISKLICSDDNYTLFRSPVGGSGGLSCTLITETVSGTNSQVYDLVSATGLTSVGNDAVQFIGCTSLGVFDGYRQGVETATTRSQGTPQLELKGTWLGGYFIDTSLARGLTDGAYSLYKAGAGFVMSSRFRTNQNIDLPANASICDFSPSNFVNPSTVQFVDAIVTRDGVIDATDANYTPNLTPADLVSSWHDNIGIGNTFVGGRLTLAAEIATTNPGLGIAADIAGTFTASSLQHFDEPANGQLRHLGATPRDFVVYYDLIIDGFAGDEITVTIEKWDDSASSFVTVGSQTRPINALQGGRDVGFFNLLLPVILDQNDYIKLQAANGTSGTRGVTLELDGFLTVTER